jgi:hypothetical protein
LNLLYRPPSQRAGARYLYFEDETGAVEPKKKAAVQFNRGADSAEGKSRTWRQAGLNHHRFGYAEVIIA